MLRKLSTTAFTSTVLHSSSLPKRFLSPFSIPTSTFFKNPLSKPSPSPRPIYSTPTLNILSSILGKSSSTMNPTNPQDPDTDSPSFNQEFAQFGAGCFWGVELAFQRVPGVTKTEVGYSQGYVDNPSYKDVCSGSTNHKEVVRVQYCPKECSYETLLEVFWASHDPTTLDRQGNDVGTQYRSGIYYYSLQQEKAAKEAMERHQKRYDRKIVTEILPAKKFYRAEEYHQQYLAKKGSSRI